MIEDKIHRHERRWPLQDLQDIRNIAAVAPYVCDRYPIVEAFRRQNEDTISDNPIQNLRTSYPDLEYLIENFGVIAAGGAVYKAIYGMMQTADVDLFFIGNINKEEAEKKLIDILRYFEETHPNRHFDRNQNVTTVIITPSPDNPVPKKYQFIHRVYPHKDQVPGAFDLGVASALYDGKTISATPLGAFCIAARTNILDHVKRSTSYEHRLYKYFHTYGTNIMLMSTTKEKLINYCLTNNPYGGYSYFKITERLKLRGIIEGHGRYREQKPKNPKLILNFDYGDKPEPGHEDVATYDYSMDTDAAPSRNTNIAMHGRVDCINWSAKTVDGILKPKINYGVKKSMISDFGLEGQYTTIEAAIPMLKFVEDPKCKPQKVNYMIRDAKKWFGEDYSNIISSAIEICGELYKSDIVSRINNCEDPQPRLINPKISSLKKLCENAIGKTVYPNIHAAQVAAEAGVTWVENVGKNWNAAFRPVVCSAKEYYTPEFYVQPDIYLPVEVETYLRLCVRNGAGIWRLINRDALTIILKHLLSGGYSH